MIGASKLSMKWRIPIDCALIGAAVVAMSWAIYGRSPSESSIIGPSTARTGDLSVLSTRNDVSGAWLVIPEAKHEVLSDGRLFVATFSKAGTYTVVMASAASDNGRALHSAGIPVLSTHKIVVDGASPGPDPEPDPNPSPEPDPDPDPEPEPNPSADWVEWARVTALSTVTSPARYEQAKAIAGQLRSISAKIAAGAIDSPLSARVEVRRSVNQALGTQAIQWAKFSVAFAEQCQRLEDSGKLNTLPQYRIIYSSVASGLEKIVSTRPPPLQSRFQSGCKNGMCKLRNKGT